jgi:hypothetical protein
MPSASLLSGKWFTLQLNMRMGLAQTRCRHFVEQKEPSYLPGIESWRNSRIVVLLLSLFLWLRHFEEVFRHDCALWYETHVSLMSDLLNNLQNVLLKTTTKVVRTWTDVSSAINHQWIYP